MAANTSPIFILTPNTSFTEITGSNTARDGSGTLNPLFIAGPNGSRVDYITFNSAQATPATSSAMIGRVFCTDTLGTNPKLLSEIALASSTPSAVTVGQTQTIFYSNGLLLSSGQQLSATISVYTGVQDKYHVVARGGDY